MSMRECWLGFGPQRTIGWNYWNMAGTIKGRTGWIKEDTNAQSQSASVRKPM